MPQELWGWPLRSKAAPASWALDPQMPRMCLQTRLELQGISQRSGAHLLPTEQAGAPAFVEYTRCLPRSVLGWEKECRAEVALGPGFKPPPPLQQAS